MHVLFERLSNVWRQTKARKAAKPDIQLTTYRPLGKSLKHIVLILAISRTIRFIQNILRRIFFRCFHFRFIKSAYRESIWAMDPLSGGTLRPIWKLWFYEGLTWRKIQINRNWIELDRNTSLRQKSLIIQGGWLDNKNDLKIYRWKVMPAYEIFSKSQISEAFILFEPVIEFYKLVGLHFHFSIVLR